MKKELFISSCLSDPPWLDDMMRRVREEREQQYMKDLFGVPVYRVNTEDFNINYFKQPCITYDSYIKPNCIVKIEKENNKMEAKKCDRCGKLYEKKFDKNNIECIFKHEEPFFTSEEKNYSKEYIDDRKTHGVRISKCGDDIDMCPECREAFKKWFEEG